MAFRIRYSLAESEIDDVVREGALAVLAALVAAASFMNFCLFSFQRPCHRRIKVTSVSLRELDISLRTRLMAEVAFMEGLSSKILATLARA
ncbi:hypothetical protein CIT31_13500 [Mesorhizobium wenxiniae]|uniref:Uncharacterized protein n=1 Tax=Mesorhizobium wenxiniae TaxID=2014805 RepID=A0A271KH46_9HYPH|nr:hypothetical protein CIT31_13500 [Mesorhizobium wenxiniae]